MLSVDPRKKTKSQTYVRATTAEEFIEIERTNEDGIKSYTVDAKLEPFEIVSPVKIVIKDKDRDVRYTYIFSDHTSSLSNFTLSNSNGTILTENTNKYTLLVGKF